MERKNPEDIRIGAHVTASKREYLSDPARWEHYAENMLRQQLADLLQRERSEKTVTDNMVEKRLDLYVAPPDVFWRIVQSEAEKIAFRFSKER
jgi:hypothetical protein